MTESDDAQFPMWLRVLGVIISLLAGVNAFLPFAFDTSAWDAITLRVPGNQGNWWHALVGAPFFLGLPMIWLWLRPFFSKQLPTSRSRLVIWIVVGLSICATISVEMPFLLHLAGTSEWQRFWVLCLGFSIVVASGAFLFIRRRDIQPTHACLVGLNTAYLANAALCLIVYSDAPGPISSKSGWIVTMLIVWPMFLEIIWIFVRTLKKPYQRILPNA